MTQFDGRILLVSAVPPPAGGDATWALEYIAYCKKHGIIMDVVNTSVSGIREISVDDTWNMLDEVKRCFRIWKSIFHFLVRYDYAIVHMNTNCSPRGIIRDYISSLLLRIYRKPYIVHCHCDVGVQIGTGKIPNALLRKICNKAKMVFALNDASKEYLRAGTNGNIVIIPNFIEEGCIIEKKDIKPVIEKVVYCGHVRKTKGIDELIETARQMPDTFFELVGPITDDYSKEDICEHFPSNVNLVGSVSNVDVLKYLDNADVFLFPSYTEGFSRALLESMARGMPCIATGVGANEEMLGKEGGIIVATKSVDDILLAFNRIKSPEIRKKMSDANIKKVKEEYSISSIVRKMFSYYGG